MNISTSNDPQSEDELTMSDNEMQGPPEQSSPSGSPRYHPQSLDSETNSLLALKRDPAVLEVLLNIEDKPRDEVNNGTPVHGGTTKPGVKQNKVIENTMCLQQAALFSLSQKRYNLLLNYGLVLKSDHHILQNMECGFCKNNGHPEIWYTTHHLKDTNGLVRCPVLRSYTCRICGATGDYAHTIRYCPENYWYW